MEHNNLLLPRPAALDWSPNISSPLFESFLHVRYFDCPVINNDNHLVKTSTYRLQLD